MPALAQDTPSPTIDIPLLARYVPNTVGFFVEMDRLPEISARLKDRNAWRLLLHLIGNENARWQSLLAETLGLDSNAAMFDLFQERVALAAPDWHRLGEGVMVFTQSDRRQVEQLIGPGKARSLERHGRVRVIQSKTGLWIGISGRTIILSQHRGPGTLFDKSVALLAGDTKDSLARSKLLHTYLVGLPTPRNGSVYWNSPSPPASDAALTGWWPPARRGALTVRVLGEQLEIAYRGDQDEPASSYRPRVLLPWIAGLPHATLATWATSFDTGELQSMVRAVAASPWLKRSRAALAGHVDLERFQQEVVAKVGPRCIVLLAADFSRRDLAPQLGVIVEAVDGTTVVRALHALAEQVAEAAGTTEDGQPALAVATSTHLGVTIYEVRLSQTSPSRSDTLASLITDDMVPSFAAVKDWVVVSTSPEHIRQIIDAGNGLSPRLGEEFSFDDRTDQLSRSVSAAVVQPSLAIEMLRHWNGLLQARLRGARGGARLGVSVHAQPRAGEVIIADVHTNGPSVGLLQPDDAVIACNDQLLPMEGANERLRNLLADTPPGTPVRLRLFREGAFAEVIIPPQADAAEQAEKSGISAFLERLAPLDGLLLELELAVYSVELPSDGARHSRLVLEFQRPRPPAADQGQ